MRNKTINSFLNSNNKLQKTWNANNVHSHHQLYITDKKVQLFWHNKYFHYLFQKLKEYYFNLVCSSSKYGWRINSTSKFKFFELIWCRHSKSSFEKTSTVIILIVKLGIKSDKFRKKSISWKRKLRPFFVSRGTTNIRRR